MRQVSIANGIRPPFLETVRIEPSRVLNYDHAADDPVYPELVQITRHERKITTLMFQYAVTEDEAESLKARMERNVRGQIREMMLSREMPAFLEAARSLADEAERQNRMREQMRRDGIHQRALVKHAEQKAARWRALAVSMKSARPRLPGRIVMPAQATAETVEG